MSEMSLKFCECVTVCYVIVSLFRLSFHSASRNLDSSRFFGHRRKSLPKTFEGSRLSKNAYANLTKLVIKKDIGYPTDIFWQIPPNLTKPHKPYIFLDQLFEPDPTSLVPKGSEIGYVKGYPGYGIYPDNSVQTHPTPIKVGFFLTGSSSLVQLAHSQGDIS